MAQRVGRGEEGRVEGEEEEVGEAMVAEAVSLAREEQGEEKVAAGREVVWEAVRVAKGVMVVGSAPQEAIREAAAVSCSPTSAQLLHWQQRGPRAWGCTPAGSGRDSPMKQTGKNSAACGRQQARACAHQA